MSPTSRKSGYRAVDVQTATAEQHVVMLYDGLLKNLKRARLHAVAGHVAGRNEALMRARDIVDLLADSLNTDVRADVVSHLDRLYGFFADEFVAIGRALGSRAVPEGSEALVRLDAVTELVAQLYDAFAQAEATVRMSHAGAS
jgi:flagellar biosynthetic protein FliS